MKNKLTTLIMLLLCLVLCLFAFASCDKNDKDNNETTADKVITEKTLESTSVSSDDTGKQPEDTTVPNETTQPADDTGNTLPEECKHSFGDWTTVQQATCNAEGKLSRTCSKCSETEESTTPKLNHVETIDKAVDATCTETGLTEGKHCSVCKTVITAQTEVPVKPHTYDDIYDAFCNVCGYEREAACPHANPIIVPCKEATCTATGLTEGKYCLGCGEAIVAQTVIPVKPHTEVTDKAVEATCTSTGLTEGKHCRVCNTVTVAQTVTSVKPHTDVIDKAVAATCTDTGLTEGKHCGICRAVLIAQQTVAALGHKPEHHEAKAPTCTEVGWEAYVTCERNDCNYTTYVEIPITHTMNGDRCTECYYPYVTIQSVADLKNISTNLGGKFILMNDINLGGIEWTPIGTQESPFCGVFEGNGYKIYNFKITRAIKYAGLFGFNKGTINNMGVEEFTIDVSSRYSYSSTSRSKSSYSYAGGLVGYNYDGKITNCYATGNVNSTDSYRSSDSSSSSSSASYSYAGGLIGYNYNGEIAKCYATGDISSSSHSDSIDASYGYNPSSSYSYTGGLVGENKGTISNCYATGNISSSCASTSDADCYSYSYTGGLVGYHSGNGTITNCHATGNVSSSSSCSSYSDSSSYSYAGGLVGYHTGKGTIGKSYATGDISLVSSSSYISSSSYSYGGGLVGYHSGNGRITNCYSTGDISSSSPSDSYSYRDSQSYSYSYSYAGGLVGENEGTIDDCYATGDISSTSSSNRYNSRDGSSSSYSYAGGLVGENKGTISNCYATGNVSSTSSCDKSGSSYSYAGGLVGESKGTIKNCFHYNEQTIQGEWINNLSAITEDMSKLQSYSFHVTTLGWSTDDWNIVEGQQPTLKKAGTKK